MSYNRIFASWRPWDAGSIAQSKSESLRSREVNGIINSQSETEGLRTLGVAGMSLESQGQKVWSTDVEGQEEECYSSRRHMGIIFSPFKKKNSI